MGVWIYLAGFVTTFATIFGIREYNDICVYDQMEEYTGVFLKAAVWPLTLLCGMGIGGGILARAYKNHSLLKKEERLRLEESHTKLLKEAGL